MRRWIFSLLALCALCLNAGTGDCFTIIVGKKASADRSVFMAHNEDDAGKNVFVNIHKIAGGKTKGIQYQRLKNGALVPQAPATIGCLWLQVPGFEFADSYLNERGVVVVSNACQSRENKGVLTNGGIGFMLRRIIGQRAKTAREAVKMAGDLIERYGYYANGRTLCIADAAEGWVFHAVKGKHWVAQRVPDNHVAVIANCYTIRRYNPQDKENFMGSANLIDYAVKRKWYDPQKDGPFDFARAYGEPSSLISPVNTLRSWRAANLLSKRNFRITSIVPFSFRTRREVRLTDLFKVLRDHYEDTEYDLTDNYKKGSPNITKNRTICTESTRYAMVAQLRIHPHLEIAHLAWIALGRPDANAFSPWYLSVDTPPVGYTQRNSNRALKDHFDKKVPPRRQAPLNFAYSSCALLADLVDQQYRKRRKIVAKEWDNLEDYAIKYTKKKEKELRYLLQRNSYIAKQIITNYVHSLEYRRWFLVSEFIHQFRKKIFKKQ